MKKLIFIDDSPLDHYILKRILYKYSLTYDVNCTADGEEVIHFLKKHRRDEKTLPDVILLDLYMPDFDGWTFLEKLQKLHLRLAKPVKIYILSASINPNDINRAKCIPIVKEFVFKPITKDALQKLVEEEMTA
jgi:CheY-like chemotaxis protein